MISALKAETRKLFSVKATYFILFFTVVLVILFGFYGSGWRASKFQLLSPFTLQTTISDAVSTISIFASLIGVLLVTQEYRYNTIMHTLTLSNSRTRVFFSKIAVMSIFAVCFTVVFGLLAVVLTGLGMRAHGFHLVPQTFYYKTLIWHTLFYGWGYTMAGLVVAYLIRNQVGAIITLLIFPNTVEGLLSLLLKNNVVYLPFTSLSEVIGRGFNYNSSISPARAALVFIGYLVVGMVVSWVLFLRRDAN